MGEGPVRVLLVEDDQDDYLLTRELFGELPAGAYHLDRVATFDDAVLAIEDCRHDLYLIDYRLGPHTGLELLAKARASGCVGADDHAHRPARARGRSLGHASRGRRLPAQGRAQCGHAGAPMRYALAQKRLEEEIRQANSQLEQRVRQRTAELNELNEALHAEVVERSRAEAALREADRRKDEFLATLAHELRNPLAPLTSATQLIAADPERLDQVKQLAGIMSQQLEQLVRLIDDLVDVSRINSGKLRLRTELVNVAEFTKAAIDQSRPLIESSRHTFTVSLPPEPLVVYGDKVRLAQIASNLLINAAKYTPSGGRIELTVCREAGHAIIAVGDNGIGIPPEMQSRIFDLFAQVDSSTTRSHGGLGIGLTIVRTLVEMHGGTIAAASEGTDRGSVFTVRLPLVGVVDPARQPLPTPADDGPLPGLTILLVDDNQSAAHMMSRLLQKLGQHVHVADCGHAALVQVPQVVPDIVISDVAMPGMSGYELAREIRGLNLPRRPFLVAVTGYGQDSDKQEALAAGFDKHLTKPVGVATLSSFSVPAADGIDRVARPHWSGSGQHEWRGAGHGVSRSRHVLDGTALLAATCGGNRGAARDVPSTFRQRRIPCLARQLSGDRNMLGTILLIVLILLLLGAVPAWPHSRNWG